MSAELGLGTQQDCDTTFRKHMLDTKSHIETPEGVRLPISVASICPRAYAYAIDGLIRLIVIAGYIILR
ncbi:MAG: hypothetical protein EOO68_09630 [Moraxellaceae bacterium]|nr:MAG: hypothetical protein EOO68_09630 [Moraxellaceae bacterium]